MKNASKPIVLGLKRIQFVTKLLPDDTVQVKLYRIPKNVHEASYRAREEHLAATFVFLPTSNKDTLDSLNEAVTRVTAIKEGKETLERLRKG